MGNACGKPRLVTPDGRPSADDTGMVTNFIPVGEHEQRLHLEAAEEEGLKRSGNTDGARSHARMLLLGTSEAGKSTLARSMIHSFDGVKVRVRDPPARPPLPSARGPAQPTASLLAELTTR